MVILLLLRRDQKKKETEIDKNIVSVADFTVYIKRIPTEINCDYEKEIK
jgi:hypothetical protein